MSKRSDKKEILTAAKFDYSTIPKTLLNPQEAYEDIKTLGEGGSAHVELIIDPVTDKKYALKILHNVQSDPEEAAIELEKDVNVLKKLSRHPNCAKDIVCYYDVFQLLDENGDVKYYAILMEYIDGVPLQGQIALTEKNILEIGLWLTAVLTDIHNKGFIHRDISLDNIMLTPTNELKLIDFGLSCSTSRDNENVPVCKTEENNILGYDNPKFYYAKDDYRAGMTLFRLANKGFDPYDIVYNGDNSFRAILATPTFKNQCFNDVVKQMIALDESERINCEEANILFQKCYDEHYKY